MVAAVVYRQLFELAVVENPTQVCSCNSDDIIQLTNQSNVLKWPTIKSYTARSTSDGLVNVQGRVRKRLCEEIQLEQPAKCRQRLSIHHIIREVILDAWTDNRKSSAADCL